MTTIAEILSTTQGSTGTGTAGPLARLESSASFGSLQYPFDLGSEYKKHWVEFQIKNLETTTLANDMANGGSKAVTNLKGAVDQVLDGDFSKAVDTVTNAFNNLTPRETLLERISLYTPDTLEFSQASHYNDTSYQKIIKDAGSSLASSLGGKKQESLASKVVAGVTGLFDPNDLTKLAASKMGYAFNPQMQLLFDGIDFRTYSMSFTFTPYSKSEAENIRRIVNRFRYHSAPEISGGLAGFVFKTPAVFDIKFYSGQGRENQYINKVSRSVLESVQVNYAPNGWSAHVDGAPTQTTMVLNFKEISLLDKQKLMQHGALL